MPSCPLTRLAVMNVSSSLSADKWLAWCCRVAAVFALSWPGFGTWKALGPFGGPAAFVQVDPHASGVVIAGTANAYLFRSRDGGEAWHPLAFSYQGTAILHVLFIHPQIPNMYLAGISAVFPTSSGLLRSSDGGTSWEPVPEFRNTAVRAISIFRGDPRVLVAGTNSGVFQSTDAGRTWSRISPRNNRRLQPVVSVAFDPNNKRIIFAGTPHLAWKSTTSGKTWRSIHVGMLDDSDVFSVTVDRNRRQRVFAAACSGIYRSLDAGSTWTKLHDARAMRRTYTVVQDPQHENLMFAGLAEGIIRSQDGGETWTMLAPYTTRSIAFDLRRLGRVYIATDEAGILRSDDNGSSWQQINRGFCNLNLAPLTLGEGGIVYTHTIASAVRTLFRTVSRADEWSFEITGVVSNDDSSTWAHRERRASQPSVNDFLVFPWPRDYFTMPWNRWSNGSPKAADSFVVSDRRWSSHGGTSELSELPDGDVTNNHSLVLQGVSIYGILRLSADRLLAATSAGLRLSDDAGNSWRTIGGTLEGNTIQAICRHPRRASTLFAASHGVIYISSDSARTWSKLSAEGLPIGSVKQIIVAAGPPDQLLALTRQHGVYTLALDSQTLHMPR